MAPPKKQKSTAARNATGLKKVLRAAGFVQATKDPRQVEHGKKTLAPYVDKTKPHRFVKGDPRLVGPRKDRPNGANNAGTRNQLLAPNAIPGVKKRISEILKELQDQPIAQELAKLVGAPEGSTLGFAVAVALYSQALTGDVNAIKLLQFNTEGMMDQPAPVAGPQITFEVVGVKPETIRRELDANPNRLLPEPINTTPVKVVTPFSITEDK